MIHTKNKCIIQAARDREIDYMIVGCNCFSTWGAGLNKSLKKEFPTAYAADVNDWKEPWEKIGSYTYSYQEECDCYIINAYTQYDYGTDYRRFEYGAWRMFLESFCRDFTIYNKRIGLPEIGCGLAGGDVKIMKLILEEYLEEATIYRKVDEARGDNKRMGSKA